MVDFKGLARLFMKKDGTSELDVVYPIKSECQAEMPKTRFKLRVSSPLLPFGHLLNCLPFTFLIILHGFIRNSSVDNFLF